VQNIVTANGTNDITLETNAQAAGIVSVFGGTGADTFDASHAAYNLTGVYFNGGGGADDLTGGGSTDTFVFATRAALAAAAAITGNGGNDTISLTTQGQAVLNADFANVTSVQALTFADGTGSSAVLAGTANTAGIASVYGGSGNDTLTVDETIYTAPTFHGAGGTDVLILSNDAATLVDTFFTDVLSVASVQTANGANDITLGVEASQALIATVTGGTGNDILNAVAMTSAVTLMGGLGEDTLTGGSGGSRQQGWSGTASANTYRDTLTGGSGADSFVLGNAVSNAYGFDSNPATNYRALINGFDTGATDDVLVLNALGQSGALTVEASTTIANRMDIKMGGLLVYRFNYDNAGQTAALYVGDSTNVVAEFNNFTSGGQNLSTSNFQILG
jgi:Ca2+-binding RTX toxin-like protein